MSWSGRFIGIVGLVLVVLHTTLAGAQTAGDGLPQTSNPAASPEARAVLRYLQALSADELPGVLSGQNCGHGDEIVRHYPEYFDRLHEQSGQWIAVAGVDYEFIRAYAPEELSDANRVLIDHWNAGGLVTINVTPKNPALPEGDVRTEAGSLARLLEEGTEENRRWMASLDRWAAALAELRDAGVVVLWRPMQEMNGDHPTAFWYSSRYNGAEHVRRVWRHMHDYFSNEKGLDNLLWVYSEIGGGCDDNTNPGADVIDVVAPTGYSDELKFWHYDDCAEFHEQHGTPVGWAEMGHWFDGADGSFDMRAYVDALAAYPKCAYWVSWHSWTGSKMAIVENAHANELMNDERVLTRDDVNWRAYLRRPTE